QNCLTDLDVSCDLIFSTEYNSNGYKKIKLLDDRLVCVVSKKLIKKIYGKYSKEKLEELKTANPLDALRELPFVALSSSATNLLYADNSISHMFSEKKIQIITRTNSIGYVNSLCRSGQQACIVNEHHFKHSGEYDSDILILPIKELPKIVMYLYYLRESSLNPYVKKFIETAKNYFKT
nr:hypothetical protein [Eubacterium sp.]